MASDTDTQRDALHAIVTSIDAALQTLDPIVDGVRHEMEARNLSPDALAAASAAMTDFSTRRQALATRRMAIQGLLADGYPDLYTALPLHTVSVDVLAELRKNLAAQEAAIAQYQVAQEPVATGGTFTLGTPEPKPA
jgi:hypothetical protein